MDSSSSARVAPPLTSESPRPRAAGPDDQPLRHGPKRPESSLTTAHHGPKRPERDSSAATASSSTAAGSAKLSAGNIPSEGKTDKAPVKGTSTGGKASKNSSKTTKNSKSTCKRDNENQANEFDTRLSKLESMLSGFIAQQQQQAVPATPTVTARSADHDPTRADELMELDYYDDDYINQPGSFSPSGRDVQHELEVETEFTDPPHLTQSQTEAATSAHEKVVPALAAKFAAEAVVGPDLNDEIAETTTFLMHNKLGEKVLDETTAKYLPPANCATLDAPMVNQTIWNNLTASTRSRDVKLSRVQKSLTRGLTAFAQSLHPSTLSEKQYDALALLANANYEMNALRKELIKPEMNSAYSHLCKASTPVTKHLFGDDLGRWVKDMMKEERAAVGVVNTRKDSGRGRIRPSAYHPYANREFSRVQYRAAGWTAPTSRPASGSRARPFLDKVPYFKQRRPPPAQGQAPDRRAQSTAQTQGRYRSSTQQK